MRCLYCVPLFLVMLTSVSAFIRPPSRIHALAARSTVPVSLRHVVILKSTPEGFVSDEQLEELLDDMIYSGDVEGYARRRAKEVINEDFLDYLQERVGDCHDDDEKQVLEDIIKLVTEKLRLTDGLVDSEVSFAERLDKILFTAPQNRRRLVEDNIVEMTPGFIDYVQREMKDTSDSDSKVVLASILSFIGQAKGADLLGKDVEVLAGADATLGEEFAKKSAILEGMATGDKNEQILAGLIFSTNDVLEDVLNNIHVIDDDFVAFLQSKVDSCQDIEERTGLNSLLQTINVVMERVKDAQGEDNINVFDDELTMDQVRQRMQEVQMGQTLETKDSIARKAEFAVKADKKETFRIVLSRLQNIPADSSLEAVVSDNYELCDYEFMEMLRSEEAACVAEGADIEAKEYTDILLAINKVMVDRMGTAQERLQRILSKRIPKAMESEVVAMARKGEVDEALILLIQANAQQAEAAGAEQAADVLRKLSRRIQEEQERKLPDEQRLLRALMRISDSEKRKGLLYDAFKPAKSMDSEGNMSEGAPLISPPSFINVVRSFIESFGNVEKFDIMGRAQIIIDEAQEVATELYGEGMSPRDQQRYMFEKNTVSVWDLANFEEQAMMSGEEVPWGNNKYDSMAPEDVLGQRKIQIGGQDGV